MIRFPSLLFLAGIPWTLAAAPIQPRQDLLRFVNGDQLHGTFLGFKSDSSVVWQRPDLAVPGEFKSTQIQKVILRAGRPEKSNESLAHVALASGDRIPGTLVALDDDTLTLDTGFAGVIHIPRKLVGMIAPMPLGGRVRYHGPYSEDGWQMIHPNYPEGIPAPSVEKAKPDPNKDEPIPNKEDADPAKDKPDAGKDKPDAGKDKPDAGKDKPDADKDKPDAGKVEQQADKDLPAAGAQADDEANGGDEGKAKDAATVARWQFSGDAWYWNQKQGGTALVRKDGMKDRSILRFNLTWRNHLMFCLAFHADFARPARADGKDENDDKAKEEARKRQMMNRLGVGDISSFPLLFGNSYVLQLNSGYAVLLRCGFNEDGKPTMERLQMNNPGIRLPETGTASLELRCDRIKGTISLHIDGEFAMQWTEPGAAESPSYAGKGSGIGFLVQVENSPVRVSDVIIADWNGMPDSARSMQLENQDIVLLANGTDRFSGKVTSFQNGKLGLHGKFGDFSFPLGELAEVRFASNDLAKSESPGDDRVIVRLDPLGNISGKPVSADASALKLLTPYAGEINLKLESAIILDFQPSNNLLDDWDPQF